jgi:hypothetical protein
MAASLADDCYSHVTEDWRATGLEWPACFAWPVLPQLTRVRFLFDSLANGFF